LLSAQPFHWFHDKLLANQFDAPVEQVYLNG
jgi:hypothetical protein